MNFDTEQTTTVPFHIWATLLISVGKSRSNTWVLSILRRFLTSDNHKMAEKHKKGFALSEEKEQDLLPPPFTLLNNKTKVNDARVLSTSWALNYSFSAHFFYRMNTEMWTNFSCPKSSDTHDQSRQGEGKDSKDTCEKRNTWTTFSKSEKHFFFLIHGKRYLYKNYKEQNTIIQRQNVV